MNAPYRFSKYLAHALMLSLCVATVSIVRADQPATEPSWHQIKSVQGKSTSKKKPKAVKFQVGTNHWRLSVKADVDKTGGAQTGNMRIALMIEKIRNVEDKPENWAQVDVIYQGQVPGEGTREFDNGFDKDGKPVWLELQITGDTSTYEITIDDQTVPVEKSKPRRKKKD